MLMLERHLKRGNAPYTSVAITDTRSRDKRIKYKVVDLYLTKPDTDNTSPTLYLMLALFMAETYRGQVNCK